VRSQIWPVKRLLEESKCRNEPVSHVSGYFFSTPAFRTGVVLPYRLDGEMEARFAGIEGEQHAYGESHSLRQLAQRRPRIRMGWTGAMGWAGAHGYIVLQQPFAVQPSDRARDAEPACPAVLRF
jgi:hypothetical protein